MKFEDLKVGMEVRIKSNADRIMRAACENDCQLLDYVDDMEPTLGSIVKIVELDLYDKSFKASHVDMIGDFWFYAECIDDSTTLVYPIGSIFRDKDDNGLYVLSRFDAYNVIFMSLRTANRYSKFIKCSNTGITHDEMLIIGSSNFILEYNSYDDMVAGKKVDQSIRRKVEYTCHQITHTNYASKEEFEAESPMGYKFVRFIN